MNSLQFDQKTGGLCLYTVRLMLVATMLASFYSYGQAGPAASVFHWSNPIYVSGSSAQDTLRDPDIIQDNGLYYLVYTMWPFRNFTDRNLKLPDDGSSPGIALYSSSDLKKWTFNSWILKSSELPEIHKISGRYYVIFGGSNWISGKYNAGGKMGYYQFIAVADKITGPYSHITELQGPGVDTSLFQDDDGQTYVVWPRNEIHAVDLKSIDQGIVTVGPALSQAATSKDFRAIGKPIPETIEGPYMIKHDGTYYLFFAETYRGRNGFYDTGVATATDLKGPWRLDPRWRIFPGGHQAEFIGPDGGWWTSFRHEQSSVAPWLSIDPIHFTTNGEVEVTPTIGPSSVPLTPEKHP
jgi:xylan 1,4-beta-xylosidase